MRGRARGIALGMLVGILSAGAVFAEELDASQRLVCAVAEVAECDATADCARAAIDQIDLPSTVRVDFAGKQIASEDGERTSPISALETLAAVLVLQGHQNGRGWTVVIDRTTGHLSATVADAEGAFVLAGGCTAE